MTTTALEESTVVEALVPAASPELTLQRQVQTADALTRVIEDRKLYASIQGKRYLTVDAWSLLATLVGVSTLVVETTQIDGGYRAAVEARRVTDGMVVGRAEAICTREERMWSKRDEYALLGMAQTRATSRALRGCLGAIVSLAGFQTVGAEEIPSEQATAGPAAARMLWKAAQNAGFDKQALKTLVESQFGKSSLRDLTLSEVKDLHARLKEAA